MGSPCALEIYAPSAEAGEAWIEAGVAEVLRLERKYSRFRDDSVTAEINASAGSPVGLRVDEETASLLDYAATAHQNSGGRFDITSGVLREVWDFHSGRIPSRTEVAETLERVGWSRLRWERPRLHLPRGGMQLDFGGYVKEYAADRTAQRCRDLGCRAGLVDLGGDLSVIGPHPDGSPWRIGIRDPRAPESAIAHVDVFAGGVATSGDYERYMIVDGVRYTHVLDPRTGWPVQGLAGVTVLASHCLIAGTATTVAMLHGCKGERWLEGLGLPHVRVRSDGAVSRRLAPARRSPPHEGSPRAPH